MRGRVYGVAGQRSRLPGAGRVHGAMGRRTPWEGAGRVHGWTGLLATALFTFVPASIAAQEDFRSADLGRPIRVEDAGVIEHREMEFELGGRLGWDGDGREFEGVLEFKGGFFPNTEFGIEIEPAVAWPSGGGSARGIESFAGHIAYAISTETPSAPALGIRLEASGPGSGPLRQLEPQFGVAGLMTRSFGRLRIHGNGGYVVADPMDGGDYWSLGLGGDYPIGLFSRAVLADVYAELPRNATDTRVWIDVGTRLQVTNRSVVDIGVATRVDAWTAGSHSFEITIGVSRASGFSGRVPDYPDPAIR